MEKQKESSQNNRTELEEVKTRTEYKFANEQAKKEIRVGKWEYVEEQAPTAGKAATKGDINKLYDKTKNVAGECSKPELTKPSTK
ncbi:unnamed protein product [Schistosoma margrebowiei]|uniref:Uncharacterized protein n=1 Tax=Schistosoma margrebowiei TaxID=48269 RepID=A0A183LBR4_9TREM|nr:unnamed protein product [Schistosoma margrebowiei]